MRFTLCAESLMLSRADAKEESPDRTSVAVKESMDGPWMAKIHPSEELTEADRSWLAALKKAAEADNKPKK
jgi:hypothetical protein